MFTLGGLDPLVRPQPVKTASVNKTIGNIPTNFLIRFSFSENKKFLKLTKLLKNHKQ
jgi:hypothetical protein